MRRVNSGTGVTEQKRLSLRSGVDVWVKNLGRKQQSCQPLTLRPSAFFCEISETLMHLRMRVKPLIYQCRPPSVRRARLTHQRKGLTITTRRKLLDSGLNGSIFGVWSEVWFFIAGNQAFFSTMPATNPFVAYSDFTNGSLVSVDCGCAVPW
jgi:hypothetical protein